MRQHYTHTILVVEDEPIWQMNLQILCESAGYHVVPVYDASDALFRIRNGRLDPPPVLVIVDLELPNSTPRSAYNDGFEVLTACQELGLYTIVVSGHVAESELRPLLNRPEVCALVDKYRFAHNPDYATTGFLPLLQDAVTFAEAARRAEGQSPERQCRLTSLRFPPSGTPEGR